MPITRLTCPHCEQEVEINVTDVTRSRDCPRCGKYIILQFTTKAKRMKRKALLLPTAQIGEPAAKAAPRPTVVARPQSTPVVTGRDTLRATAASASAPSPSRPRPVAAANATITPGTPALGPASVQMLEGTPGERLLLDPDIKRKSSTLVWGIVVVATLIALVVAADRFHWWSALGDGFSRVITFLSPPEQESIGQSNRPSIDPDLPSAREVLSGPSEVPQMRPPEEVDSASTDPAVSAGGSTSGMSEQEKAARAVQAFLQAPSLKERVKLVSDQKLMVDRMVRYYQTHDAGPIPFQKIVAKETGPLGVLSFAFNVVLPSGEERRAVVSRPLTGQYGVDWASFVGYGEMSWKEFMETRPAAPTLMRVWAEPGEFFNEAFPKDANPICLKLADPNSKESPPLYAYAAQGTPLAMALEFISRKAAGQPQPVILTLKYPQNAAGAEPNQVLVQELVAEGWLARGR